MGNFRILILSLIVAALGLSAAARAQDRDEPIKLKADLVSLTASVTDRSGRALRSLKAADFAVYEDGVRQRIEHFAATEEPFTLLLLLDISGSTHDDIELMKRAARNFLAELRFDDRVGIIVFSRDVELIGEFTDPRARVISAIEQMSTAPGSATSRYSTATGTSFYDALYLALEDSPLKPVEGRKAIVCMSDGVDSTSMKTYKEVAPLVERSEVSLYFLELNTEEATLAGLLKDRSDPDHLNFSPTQLARYFDEFDKDSPDRLRPRETLSPLVKREINTGLYDIARREMNEMATRSGGHEYAVKTLNDLNGVYKQIADDLRSQYSLSYYPTNRRHDGGWRQLRVEVKPAGATVRTRTGYRAPAQ
ncbi:MAG TPA: VWA domain-containing protein [Blastocatellia bacterium]|nr:VWA domain-containing protein [Blastocatellia bacterium]